MGVYNGTTLKTAAYLTYAVLYDDFFGNWRYSTVILDVQKQFDADLMQLFLHRINSYLSYVITILTTFSEH